MDGSILWLQEQLAWSLARHNSPIWSRCFGYACQLHPRISTISVEGLPCARRLQPGQTIADQCSFVCPRLLRIVSNKRLCLLRQQSVQRGSRRRRGLMLCRAVRAHMSKFRKDSDGWRSYPYLSSSCVELAFRLSQQCEQRGADPHVSGTCPYLKYSLK